MTYSRLTLERLKYGEEGGGVFLSLPKLYCSVLLNVSEKAVLTFGKSNSALGPRPGCLKPDQPKINKNFNFSFVNFTVRFSLYHVVFSSILSLNNPNLHKSYAVKSIFIQEKLMLLLTGLRSTQQVFRSAFLFRFSRFCFTFCTSLSNECFVSNSDLT